MERSDAQRCLVTAYNAGVRSPIFLIGPPGTGKPELVRNAAKELGIEFVVWDSRIGPFCDPLEIPALVGGKVVKIPNKELPSEGKGFLLIDGIDAAPLTSQASLYALIEDQKLGTTLGKDWVIIATGSSESRVDPVILRRMNRILVGEQGILEWSETIEFELEDEVSEDNN